MNKRLTKKFEKKNNLSRQNNILDEISKDFTISESEFGNGYFVYDIGENAVCHFSLKETLEWKYGIWLLKNNEFIIFGEHIELIDKFKPSACYIEHKNNVGEFIEKVKNIASNPKLYFVDSLTRGDALVPWKKYEYEDGDVFYEGYQVKQEYKEETKLWDIFVRDYNVTQEQFVEREYDEYIKSQRK